ncbi:MAG TPA: SdrD B-like domain-containing protein, partial [Bacteroidota bacterium]|nr:SdrD B-like domain-containing protein [Bacteroidota bacterium]
GTWFVSMITADTVADDVHFGNWRQASWIYGSKFHDLNRNGFRDGGDTLLGDWRITIADTNNIRIRYDVTDSLGEYGLPVFEPGTYIVREKDKNFWVQTYPPNERWTVTIPDLNTTVTLRDFGNYYSDSVNSIFGRKFNDVNRNRAPDLHESGVPGFEMYLGGTKSRYRTTDDSGYYGFVGLPPGVYSVKEIRQDGWWPSLPALPETSYSLLLSSGMYVDSINFGNYEIVPSAISGSKWNDLNDNGARDLGEPGIANWKINMAGKATSTVYTDVNGDYTFSGLWPGDYTVSESWRPFWRQTHPPNLGTHGFFLGPEQNLAGITFGNTSDSSFSTTFRTFTYDSLAFGKDRRNKTKPVKLHPDKVQFSAMFVNAETTSVGEIYMKFTIAVLDSPTVSRPGILQLGGKNKIAVFTLATPMAVGETLIVSGFGKKPIPQNVRKWYWTRSDLVRGMNNLGTTFLLNVLRYPMPNTINLIQVVGPGLRVGLGGAHTVLHNTYKAVLRSMVERGDRLHLGTPRCLDRFEGISQRPISRQRRYLMPKQHNNMLFGEAITLKVNVRGSDNLNLPPGFGDLIYDEGTGGALPLNGMSVREISGWLDKYMSSFSDTAFFPSCSMIPEWAGLDVDTLLDRVRRINGSFSGPIDTTSFSTGLMFSGVGSIGEVAYLRLDTSTAMRPRIAHEEIWADVPEEFELSQNYPNPFNPTTTVEYFLPEASTVTVTIYNMLGQVVARLVDNELQEDGPQEIAIDASNLSSGIYFYRMAAKTLGDPEDGEAPRSFSMVKKMVVMK